MIENKKTVTADWYTTICLPTIVIKSPETKKLLHQDNAPTHSANLNLASTLQ